jgi:hypothetical protein
MLLMPGRGHRSASRRPALPDAVATSAAAGRPRTLRVVSLGDSLLHDRVQILQPCRIAERLAAHIRVVGYRVVVEIDRIGKGGQPVCEVELVPRHFRIAICVSKFGMHARMRPNAVREQSRVQLQLMRDYVVYAAGGVINGCHAHFSSGQR